MIPFTQVFPELSTNAGKYKVHLAIGRINKKEPLFALARNNFKEWQEYQNNKNFERDFVFSLVYYKPDLWFFGGIYRRIAANEAYDAKRQKKYWQYQTELVDIQRDLIGRLLVSFQKRFRQSYVLLENFYEQLEIHAIMPQQYKIEEFPGYENVAIQFDELKEIVREEEPTWKSALSNTKGVYVITDTSNGRHYVGSAYGENAFWDRWVTYTATGHGNNAGLVDTIEKNGIDHARNFQMAILEVRSATTDDQIILSREAHWKNVLKSRDFGYNAN